jgi:hypothetical protein
MKQDEISSSISRDRKKRSGREERQSANHGAAKSKESLEEGVEGGDSVLDTFGSLHAMYELVSSSMSEMSRGMTV